MAVKLTLGLGILTITIEHDDTETIVQSRILGLQTALQKLEEQKNFEEAERRRLESVLHLREDYTDATD